MRLALNEQHLSRRNFLRAGAAGSAALLWGLRNDKVLGQPPAAAPDSWVSFRNGLYNRGVAAAPLADKLKLVWELTTPDGTSSTAAIADGFVYMGTLSGDLHCIELKTGKQVWTYKSLENVPANSFAPGFNAPAAINDKLVFIGDDMGMFHAVSRETGKKVWEKKTGSEIVGGAQVVGEKVIFGSHDGFLYGLQASDGQQLWAVDTKGPVNATPCLADGKTITTGCDQPILRVIDTEAGRQAAEVPMNDTLLIAAATWDGQWLYYGNSNGQVVSLDFSLPKWNWTYSEPGLSTQIKSSPAINNDVLVIGAPDKAVWCLDRATGAKRWAFAARGQVESSPVIAGDRVYFGANDRTLYAVSLTDGTEVWREAVRAAVKGSPAIAEGHLVIGTDSVNGRILCYGPA